MDTIVMYPSIGISHILPMVELAKLIQSHYPGTFSITILITPQPFAEGVATTESAIAAIAAEFPSITFHHLSPTSQSLPAPPPSPPSPSLHFNLASLNNPLLYHTLTAISKSSSSAIKALVIDFFNAAAFDVSSLLDIPTYVYYTSSVGALSQMLYMPTIHKAYTKSFKDYYDDDDFTIHIPGIPPVSVTHMSPSLLDRNSNFYNHFLTVGHQLPRAKGFILNTFDAFQGQTLRAIRDGLCIPDGVTPPLFPVGPLVTGKEGKEGAACLRWLDAQPSRSVVFLCFGSMGVFPRRQLVDMANALERSGQRFLWVVRPPDDDNPEEEDQKKKKKSSGASSASWKGGTWSPEPDPANLESVLPEGFMERVKGRGIVVKKWAPQTEVLSHEAVGGFVSHCGWNSVLEAVVNGVPMLAWPMYAEQKTTKLFLVEDAKVAVPLKWEKDGRVRAEELERGLRELMAEDSAMRDRMRTMREEARTALGEGGSSKVALDRLVQLWKCCKGDLGEYQGDPLLGSAK